MQQRELQIVRHGWGLIGQCRACGRGFVPSPELRRQSEAQERQVRHDFEEHTCNEGRPGYAAKAVKPSSNS
jgi:hypothetical protein